MSFTNRISQTLHDEHDATVALMEQLERFLACNRRGGPPGSAAGNVARLLSDLSVGLGTEVEWYFAFEENPSAHIFGGDGRRRHRCAVDERARGHSAAWSARRRDCAAAAAKSFALAEWEEFVRLGQELVDCLPAHVQKEEMALLPVIEETMDAETEARLYQEYVENA